MAQVESNESKQTHLRRLFQNMDPAVAKDIRESFNDAMSGLDALAAALEKEDLNTGEPPAGPLLDEHFLALAAIDSMRKSELGGFL